MMPQGVPTTRSKVCFRQLRSKRVVLGELDEYGELLRVPIASYRGDSAFSSSRAAKVSLGECKDRRYVLRRFDGSWHAVRVLREILREQSEKVTQPRA